MGKNRRPERIQRRLVDPSVTEGSGGIGIEMDASPGARFRGISLARPRTPFIRSEGFPHGLAADL